MTEDQQIPCPSCRQTVSYPKTREGEVGECPHCGQKVWFSELAHQTHPGKKSATTLRLRPRQLLKNEPFVWSLVLLLIAYLAWDLFSLRRVISRYDQEFQQMLTRYENLAQRNIDTQERIVNLIEKFPQLAAASAPENAAAQNEAKWTREQLESLVATVAEIERTLTAHSEVTNPTIESMPANLDALFEELIGIKEALNAFMIEYSRNQ